MGEEKSQERLIERLKEEIHYRIEVIKITALFLLTAIGGEISLFLKEMDLKRLILFFFGLPVIVLLGLWLWLNHRKVVKLLNQLEGRDV